MDYIPGCALLMSRECLQDVGLFDPSFFAYMEDVDLGLRARRRNWSVLLRGDLSAKHAPSSATGGGYSTRRKWMQGVNSIRFLRVHGKPIHWLRFVHQRINLFTRGEIVINQFRKIEACANQQARRISKVRKILF